MPCILRPTVFRRAGWPPPSASLSVSGCWEERQVSSWWDLCSKTASHGKRFGIGLGLQVSSPVSCCSRLLLPKLAPHSASSGWASVLRPYAVVFRNPQSYLCGAVAGLLFVPTTIGDMTWGVAFFQHDRMFSFHDAVVTGSLVPLGWVIGCPLLGWLADRIGRRKPVLIGGAVAMLLSAAGITFSTSHTAAAVGCLIFGIASGAAMIPYTIVKEVNPDEVKGSATGGINFLTFGVTALIGPIFADLVGKGIAGTPNHVAHFRQSGLFWIAGIVIAILLSLFLRETGHARKTGQPGRSDMKAIYILLAGLLLSGIATGAERRSESAFVARMARLLLSKSRPSARPSRKLKSSWPRNSTRSKH